MKMSSNEIRQFDSTFFLAKTSHEIGRISWFTISWLFVHVFGEQIFLRVDLKFAKKLQKYNL